MREQMTRALSEKGRTLVDAAIHSTCCAEREAPEWEALIDYVRELETEVERLRASETAVVHLLRRVQEDPRLAYYISPYTTSLELLMAAGAALAGRDPAEFKAEFQRTLRMEAPVRPNRDVDEALNSGDGVYRP